MDDIIVITPDPLDVGAISASVTDHSTGATSLFVGTTRDNFQGKVVVRLEYEAYEPMAKKEIAKICQELRQKWPGVHKIAVHHRLGLVEVKEASIVIAISSPHRKDSLEVSPTIKMSESQLIIKQSCSSCFSFLDRLCSLLLIK